MNKHDDSLMQNVSIFLFMYSTDCKIKLKCFLIINLWILISVIYAVVFNH